MGMVTHILINNDAFHHIKSEPESFVRSIQAEMNYGGITELVAGRNHVGYCSMAHHSSYSEAYQNEFTRMVKVGDKPVVARELPLPGDEFDGGIVLGSGFVADHLIGLLLMYPEKPGQYYAVGEYNLENYRNIWSAVYENIVPAAAAFADFEFWGGA